MDDDFDFNFLRDLAPTLCTTLLCGYEAEDLFGGYLTSKSITNEYINPIIYKLLTCFFDESDFEIDAISGDSSNVANHILDKYYNDPNDSAARSIAEDISRWFDVDIYSKQYIPIWLFLLLAYPSVLYSSNIFSPFLMLQRNFPF